ncbi:hypothetical protein [Paenibacillus cremeus]|uniref:Uncharacterized protein n=1 Tax=Paenibacillus cremeus TaxID=2163881 RepID=A0A559KCP3_9BACL|nr:hypothetical protein [Paenibacillus cremeus]TVY09895.1 hypothetical protein FPZ49_11020 [Paenibacillus cremeus]
MLEKALFILLSSLEFSSILLLVMSIFHFHVKYYIKELVGSSVLLAGCSYIIIELLNMQQYAIPIQVLLVVAMMILMFKQKLLYGFFTSIVGYAAFLSVQGLLVFIIKMYNIVDLEQIQPDSFEGHALQVVTVTIIYIFCWYIKFTNTSFGFELDGKENVTTKNIVFLNLGVLVVIQLAVFSYMYFSEKNATALIAFVVILILITMVTIYFSSKRNKEEFSRM